MKRLLNFIFKIQILFIIGFFVLYKKKTFNLPISEEFGCTIVMISAIAYKIFKIEDKINKN